MKKRIYLIIVVVIVVFIAICNIRHLFLRRNLHNWLKANPVSDTHKEFRIVRSYDKYQITVSEDDIYNVFDELVRNISLNDLHSKSNNNFYVREDKPALNVMMMTAENEECIFQYYYDDRCVYLLFDQETAGRFGNYKWFIKNAALSDYCSKVIQ